MGHVHTYRVGKSAHKSKRIGVYRSPVLVPARQEFRLFRKVIIIAHLCHIWSPNSLVAVTPTHRHALSKAMRINLGERVSRTFRAVRAGAR
jgi:hypothetical protein